VGWKWRWGQCGSGTYTQAMKWRLCKGTQVRWSGRDNEGVRNRSGAGLVLEEQHVRE